MGCCISKCNPNKKQKQNTKKPQFIDDQAYCSYVQDKLVVSQKPPSSSASTSTAFSSVSCSSESSMASTSSSSFLSVSNRDRAFSNEFLWACARENPHIISRNVIQKSKHDFPSLQMKPTPVPPIPEITGTTMAKKRARASSPTIVRQKSFRKEPNSRAMMRSPSPSRRFNGESFRDSPVCSRRCNSPIVRRANSPGNNYLSSPSMRKDNFSFRAPPSPNYHGAMKKTENEMKGTRNCKSEVGEKDNAGEMDLEAMEVEDIDNPLIALDFFIFL